MYIALIMFFFDVILYILVIMHIPQKKYYKINQFKNFLLNYEGNCENINNYTKYINDLEIQLKNCSKINQGILALSIILLFLSIVLIFIKIIYILKSRESTEINIAIFQYSGIINFIRFILSFFDWIMALGIIVTINYISEEEDKIGLINEIKSGILKVIIILTFYFIYCIFEIIFIKCYTKDIRSLFIYNKYYIEN